MKNLLQHLSAKPSTYLILEVVNDPVFGKKRNKFKPHTKKQFVISGPNLLTLDLSGSFANTIFTL